MIQFSYRSKNVGKLLKNPEDCSIAAKSLNEKPAGKMLAIYCDCGEYNGVVKAERLIN